VGLTGLCIYGCYRAEKKIGRYASSYGFNTTGKYDPDWKQYDYQFPKDQLFIRTSVHDSTTGPHNRPKYLEEQSKK